MSRIARVTAMRIEFRLLDIIRRATPAPASALGGLHLGEDRRALVLEPGNEIGIVIPACLGELDLEVAKRFGVRCERLIVGDLARGARRLRLLVANEHDDVLKEKDHELHNNACLALEGLIQRHHDLAVPPEPVLDCITHRVFTCQQKGGQVIRDARAVRTWARRRWPGGGSS